MYADRCDNSLFLYSLTDFLFHQFASLCFLFTGVTYGSSVMVCCESPNSPFTILCTQFCEGMMQFGKFKRLLPRVLLFWGKQNDFGSFVKVVVVGLAP